MSGVSDTCKVDTTNFGAVKFDATALLSDLDSQGYHILRNAFPNHQVASLKQRLAKAIEQETAFHGGPSFRDYAMVMLCALYGKEFVELFDNSALYESCNSALGPECIVYAYTSSSMPPKASNYSKRIHVDCPRWIANYRTQLNVLIPLDDFTEENGATYFLPGSHLSDKVPSEQEFFANAIRLIVPSGTLCVFDANLWHLGGENNTDHWRHALTLNMCRGFMKQRLDIPRMLSKMDLSNVSEQCLQKFGFYAQVPENYEQYYAPSEKRAYRQKRD